MIGIIGAGRFGTALALSLAGAGREVRLWGRDDARMSQMRAARQSPYFAQPLPERLAPVSALCTLRGAQAILLVIPAQALRGFLAATPDLPLAPYVLCAKGVERGTGALQSEVLRDFAPQADLAVLSGPGFADELCAGKPTALTLASEDPALAQRLQRLLSAPNLRLYRAHDVTGVQLGGALKNIIAIACGIAIGAGLGESARAALMTRGFAEMRRIAMALGAEAETLTGLSGFGDLVLTACSPLSRNFSHGLEIGRLGGLPEAAAGTIEGVASAAAVAEDAVKRGLDLPITQAVARITKGALSPNAALAALLTRPLKEED